MNLPNKLTIMRVFLIPVFMVFLMVDSIPCNYLFALIVFAAASITDYFDGRIARSRNLVTTFGKLMDPLADKLLVISALIGMIKPGLISPVVTFIIIMRETSVTALRSVAASAGTVIAANMFGKIKTVLQMSATCISLGMMAIGEMFFDELFLAVARQVSVAYWWAVGAYTLFTLFVYFKQNFQFIDPTK